MATTDAESCAGRIIGVVIISQMILGVLVNFVLEAPLFGTPGFALTVVVLAVAVVENAAVISMVSLSEASARNWPHFLARVLDGCTIFAFYAVL